MRSKEGPPVWVLTLVLGLATVGLGGLAIGVSHHQADAQEERDEAAAVADEIASLDARIDRIERQLQRSESDDRPQSVNWSNWDQAVNARDRAEGHWLDGNLSAAREEVRISHQFLEQIRDEAGFSAGTLVLILIVLAITGAAGYYVYQQNRRW